MIQIEQLSEFIFLGENATVPKGEISILAHNKGQTGDLYVSYTEETKRGGNLYSESITFLYPSLMKADEWEGLLIGLLSVLSKRRFNNPLTLVEAALKEIPATLFLTGWRTLKLMRKDEEE